MEVIPKRGVASFLSLIRRKNIIKNPEGKLIHVSASGTTISRSYKQRYTETMRKRVADVPLFMQVFVMTDPKTKDWKEIVPDWRKPEVKFPDMSVSYTLEHICWYINEIAGTNFDRVVVLSFDSYAGYYILNEDRTKYNRGDTFHYQPRIAKKRQEKVAELTELHKKQFGERYDNTSYWVGDDRKLHMRINVSDKVREAAGYDRRDYIIEM